MSLRLPGRRGLGRPFFLGILPNACHPEPRDALLRGLRRRDLLFLFYAGLIADVSKATEDLPLKTKNFSSHFAALFRIEWFFRLL